MFEKTETQFMPGIEFFSHTTGQMSVDEVASSLKFSHARFSVEMSPADRWHYKDSNGISFVEDPNDDDMLIDILYRAICLNGGEYAAITGRALDMNHAWASDCMNFYKSLDDLLTGYTDILTKDDSLVVAIARRTDGQAQWLDGINTLNWDWVGVLRYSYLSDSVVLDPSPYFFAEREHAH